MAGDAPRQRCAVSSTNPVQHHHAHMRLANPGRLAPGAKRNDGEDPTIANSFYKQIEQLACAEINPVHILPDN
jgi:hypothetical protein